MIAFDIFANDIQQFCIKNNLDFNKVKASPMCGNETVVFIQRFVNDASNVGLNNEEPAEVILVAKKDDGGKVQIKKQKNTDKYLSI